MSQQSQQWTMFQAIPQSGQQQSQWTMVQPPQQLQHSQQRLIPQFQQLPTMMQQSLTGQWQPQMTIGQPPQAQVAAFPPQQVPAGPFHGSPMAYLGGYSLFSSLMAPEAPSRHDDDDELEARVGATASVSQPEPDPLASSEGPLSVTTKVEYTALPKNQTHEVFGLVTLKAAQQAATSTERQATDIVAVLDVSGSMQGRKIGQVQDATRFLISQANDSDRLSIVTFNDSAQKALKLRKMNVDGKDDANKAVLRLHAGGGTSIATGLEMAVQVMEQRRQTNKVATIFLLTDGQDGSARHRLSSLLERARRANCSVYAFGFGQDHDAALLSQLAEEAQTPFSFVRDTEAHIREAFAGTIGGLLSVVAQQVKLIVNCNVQLKAMHTPFSTERSNETQTIITIPDIFAGERRDILVELVVPEEKMHNCSEHFTLLEASANYIDLRDGSAVQTLIAEMQVEPVQEPQPEQEPDEDVCVQRERVQVQQALKDAIEQGNRGDFESAQSLLSDAERRLRPTSHKSTVSVALCQQLQEAKDKMDRSLFASEGRAFMSDVCQMHSVQRCTNISLTPAQGMYCLPQQQQTIQSAPAGLHFPFNN